jgi:hypothetical protein
VPDYAESDGVSGIREPRRHKTIPSKCNAPYIQSFCESSGKEMIFTTIIALLFIAPLGWIVLRLLRQMHCEHVSVGWWSVAASLAVAGAALGFVLSNVTLPLSSSFKFQGFPIPWVFFHLEAGRWPDYVTPLPPLNVAENIITWMLALMAPLSIRFRRKNKLQNTPSDATSQ